MTSTTKKVFGVLGLLIATCIATAILSDVFLNSYNIENLLRRSALFGIISIGAAFVIIVGGIDLSIGSVIALVGCLLPWLLLEHGWSPWTAIPFVLVLGAALGVLHGVLVTKLRLQPFIVTLCGLLVYRGVARGITGDQTVGFRGGFQELRELGNGRIPLPFFDDFSLPVPVVILVIVAVLSIVFLRMTVWGRWMFAIGRSESAARHSGIATTSMTILAYTICAGLSGLGGMLFILDVGSAQPVDFGSFYELYAIAAAVLGGCALRGGEGSVIGVIIGAALMQVLRNAITLIDWINDNVEYAVIGVVILFGVMADEVLRRILAARLVRQERKKT
jgi:ribose transport system permease protein